MAVIDEFVTADECEVMEKLSNRARTRTRSEGGASHDDISAFRRTRGLFYDWEAFGVDELPTKLLKRAAMVAGAFGHKVTVGDWQEPLNVVDYQFADAYEPHCDVDCGRSQHLNGGRLATILVYCQEPEMGGATVFPSHGGRSIKVAPRANAALYFDYAVNARDALHAGCPVRAGQKRVVSIFLRAGVDAEHPWTQYDVDGRPARVEVGALGDIL